MKTNQNGFEVVLPVLGTVTVLESAKGRIAEHMKRQAAYVAIGGGK